jgi:outer membrane murein-binding lipoprotein Lpp
MGTRPDSAEYGIRRKIKRDQTEIVKARALYTLGLAALTSLLTVAGCISNSRNNRLEEKTRQTPSQTTNLEEIAKDRSLLYSDNPKFDAEYNQRVARGEVIEISDKFTAEEIEAIMQVKNLEYQNYLTNLQELEQQTDSNEKQSSPSTKQAKLTGKFSKYKQYQKLIESEVAKYNAKFKFPERLTANHIYAMIEAETGNHPVAFQRDPMQIANKGDPALYALANGLENTRYIGDFSFLKNIRPTPIRHWVKHYDETNIDAETSIRAGIAWLINKDFITNSKGIIIGYRSWAKAFERYNGGGVHNYEEIVTKHLNQMAKL